MLGSPSPAPPPLLGGTTVSSPAPQPFSSPHNATNTKKKRRPAGTPDPDAEVVSLSPRTLLESDRYVCEICNQGFQRDQNLQMHRRRHKVPWKLLKREASEVRKRVFVCPEPTCLHHDPCHALGDLVGIKKHFRRKHSSHRQWVCAKCSKAYAVQSDYKAHLKTCGTRGHSCDCGRVFSRVESFIEHQDTCTAGRARAELHMSQPPACLSTTASSPSPSSDTNFSPTMWPGLRTPNPAAALFLTRPDQPSSSQQDQHRTQNIELQLLPPSNNQQSALHSAVLSPITDEAKVTKLQLSLGPAARRAPNSEDTQLASTRLKDETMEQLKLAMAEKALADEARQQARRQLELAEREFENAKRIRQQAQMELNRAHAIRERAVKQINSTLLQITCFACRQQFRAKPGMASEENSFVVSYMSSVVTEGEEENEEHNHPEKVSKS
ncbi:unnamed protein product [Musa acuminata subsp. malaccensis]|uniref:(wild Malaysian banana) hypothetical protein n=1 Tax=Musa acuminata subsp. malaccensis TaxID=214687 RepID=A0A804JXN1_MUSAM|nr:PREDICTED: protein SHOOT GRAVITROPISM 5-like [Musa acuminata subsp. malaccensis]CAG1857189.1 unnamed protein product [Musa acuminata subsp. malaccensis]